MKKVVFCLVALSLALPLTSFAEEVSTTSEVESSSSITSTQETEKENKKPLIVLHQIQVS